MRMETDMAAQQERNEAQAKLWNGTEGRTWVELQSLIDETFKPFEDLLVEAVSARSAHQVLDVGCGTGAITLAVARLLGASGRCTGIDISEPMVDCARALAVREGSTADFI